MRNTKPRWALSLILSAGTALVFSLPDRALSQVNTASGPSEETALRALVEKYFAACARKDLADVVAMWSDKSPDLARNKESLQRLFANEDRSVGGLEFSRINVENDRAGMRVTIAVTAITRKTRQRRQQRLVRNIEFVKESAEWKVWRYAVAAEDLAMALAKANSDGQRAVLLADEKDLVTPELVEALVWQGKRALFQGNYSQGLAIYRIAHGVAQQIGDKVSMASTLSAIGGVYSFQGNNEEALEQYRKSLALSKSAGDKAGMGQTLGYMGEIERVQGDYIKALEHGRQGLALCQEAGDQTGIAETLTGIGHVHRVQGNYPQALEYFERVRKLSEASNDKVGVAHILSDIAVVHTLQGDYAEALEIYRENLTRLSGSRHNAGTVITLENIGDLHYLQGNYSQALEEYQKSLQLSEAMDDKEVIASTLGKIANVYRSKGEYNQALHLAERAAALASQIGYEELLWEARTTAGKANLALNRLDQARPLFEAAIGTIETLRTQIAGGEQDQERFFESRVSPYQAMVELLVSQGSPGEALTYAERAKGRVLLEVVHNGRVNINKAMTVQEQEEERRLHAHLASLNSQIYQEKVLPQPEQSRLSELESLLQKARLDLEAFRTNVYAAHPELKTQRGEARPLRLEEAGALLPDNKTALLEYVVSENGTYLFVLTKGDPLEVKVYPVAINQKDLTARIEEFRQMLSALDSRFSRPAHDLYDLLLRPAAEQLKGKTRLTIVPDGPLWELPFQTLQTAQNRYLIEDLTIFYAPSLTVLREMTNARRKEARSSVAPTLLALGNPALGKPTIARVKSVYMDEKLDPLPEAEQQVRSLQAIYGRNRSKIYVGAEAREDRFKLEARNFGILHLATHAVLNNRSPMYSHVLLAQTGEGSREDGLLEAWELMNLDLKAELAVLSACETARGRLSKGEGMIGLTWALFVAGVPKVVVSQWKVRSDSTAELMVEFHRQLNRPSTESGPLNNVAEALRAAALKVKSDRRYRHPFHWAGFVVVGDGY